MRRTQPIQSLLRGVDLLQILADSGEGMRLQELADRLQLKLPTVHNLLSTLALRGLVEKCGPSRYVAGPAVLRMAGQIMNARGLRRVEAGALRLGAKPYQPTVNVCRATASQVQMLLRISPDAPAVVQRPAGRSVALYRTASGLAVLAFAPTDLVWLLEETYPFEEHGMPYWQSRDTLDDAIERTRQDGVAVLPFADGAKCHKLAMMAPDRDHALTLGILVPVSALPGEAGVERLVNDLREEINALKGKGDDL